MSMIPGPGLGLTSDLEMKEGSRVPVPPLNGMEACERNWSATASPWSNREQMPTSQHRGLSQQGGLVWAGTRSIVLIFPFASSSSMVHWDAVMAKVLI